MEQSNSAYSEFQELWKKATAPNEEFQTLELNSEVKIEDKPPSISAWLKQFSHLADCLKDANAFDDERYEQMQSSIATLREVIGAVDQEILENVIASCKQAQRSVSGESNV